MAEELQESLYDLMVQYTEGEVLCDVQITGPSLSFDSYQKACHVDKKMTAEHIHLARNRVSRLAIVEHMDELEEKFQEVEEGQRRLRQRHDLDPVGPCHPTRFIRR